MGDVTMCPERRKDEEVSLLWFYLLAILGEFYFSSLWRIEIEQTDKITTCGIMIDHICMEIETIGASVSLHTEFFEESGTWTECACLRDILRESVDPQSREREKQILPSISMLR